MKAEDKKAKIKCDAIGCSFQLDVEWKGIPLWHNKKCPVCGECVILNDEDMAIWRGINAQVLMDNAVDPDGLLPRVSITIDTAGLRKGMVK